MLGLLFMSGAGFYAGFIGYAYESGEMNKKHCFISGLASAVGTGITFAVLSTWFPVGGL